MIYNLYYHPDVKDDIRHMPKNITDRIKKAIEQRLTIDPIKYGDYLKRSLYGYMKLRVGDFRVIYKIDKENVIILKIGHRKSVYDQMK